MAKLTLRQKQILAKLEAGEISPSQIATEDMFAFFQHEKEKVATVKTDAKKAEKSTQKVVSNLRAKATTLKIQNDKIEFENGKLKALNQELVVGKENYKTIYANFIEQMRLLKLTAIKICDDSVIPNIETADYVELNEYFHQVVKTIVSAVSYQTKYIEYHITKQTSEKNPRRAPNVDLNNYTNEDGVVEKDSDTQDAEDYGKTQEAYETTVTASLPEELEDNGENLSIEPKTIGRKSTLLGAASITEHFKNRVEDTDKNASVESILGAKTLLLSEYLENTKANTAGNETVVQNNDKDLKANKPLSATKAYSHNTEQGYIRMFCPHCEEVHDLKLVRKVARVNDTVILDNGRISKAKLSVGTAKCEVTGCEVEVHPVNRDAFYVYKDLKDTSDSVSGTLLETESEKLSEMKSDMLSDSLFDSKDKDKQKRNAKRNQSKKDYREIISSPSAVRYVIDYAGNTIRDAVGNEVVHPDYVVAHDGADLPLFLKSSCSVGLTVDMATWFSFLAATKSKIIKFLDDCGFTLSKAQAIGNLNGFCRAYLAPMCQKIHDDILRNNHAVLMDETTLKVRENTKVTGHVSYVWNMTSGFTEDFKATWFKVSPDRSFNNVVDILKTAQCNIKKITVDGYTAYDRGITELEDEVGTHIEITRCHTHARRQIHDYLNQTNLIKVYRETLLPKSSSFVDFERNLQQYKATQLKKLNKENSLGAIKLLNLQCNMLTIYYLINALFVIDSKVVDKYDYNCNNEHFIREFGEVRRKYSSKIISAVFDCISLTIAENPEILEVTENKTNGRRRFKANKARLEGRALMYLLKYEEQLRKFVDDPHVELSQSAAERAIRSVVCSKQNGFEFIDSVDGAHAFADFMTITNTCMLNKVPVKDYMLWLVANIRLRLNKYSQTHTDETMHKLPGRRDYNTGVKDANGEYIYEKIDMYDKRNVICYDKISLEGLAPYDYRKLLLTSQSA